MTKIHYQCSNCGKQEPMETNESIKALTELSADVNVIVAT